MKSDRVAIEQAKRILNGEKRVEEALDLAKQHERKVGECEAQLAKVEKAVAGLEPRKRRFGSRWSWHEPAEARHPSLGGLFFDDNSSM